MLVAAFILQADVPVVVNIGGQDGLPLSNKSYTTSIYSSSKFNALSVRFLSANLPVGSKIKFFISRNNKTVANHTFDEGGLAQGEFYKFSFRELDAGSYKLLIKGTKGTPYQLMYDKKKQELSSLGNFAPASFAYKLYSHKSIAYVAGTAANRASKYWFRFGYVYLKSILLYLLLLAAIFASLITGKAYAKTKL